MLIWVNLLFFQTICLESLDLNQKNFIKLLVLVQNFYIQEQNKLTKLSADTARALIFKKAC